MQPMHKRLNLGIPPLRLRSLSPGRVSLNLTPSFVQRMQGGSTRSPFHPISAASRATGRSSTTLGGLIKTGVRVQGLPMTRNGSLSITKMSDLFTGSGRMRYPTLFGATLKLRF